MEWVRYVGSLSRVKVLFQDQSQELAGWITRGPYVVRTVPTLDNGMSQEALPMAHFCRRMVMVK